ncbi:MAG TPA: GH32 C-terminal domain-containing protein [Kineosporiaceae bacterium]
MTLRDGTRLPWKVWTPIPLAALLLLTVGITQTGARADYQQDLTTAIAKDMSGLDAKGAVTLKGLFGLANGTRSTFVGGKLTDADNSVFAQARAKAISLQDAPDASFAGQLGTYLKDSATTVGGRAYLADLVPSIEMNAPGLLTNTEHQLWLNRREYAYTMADGKTLAEIQGIDLNAAEKSVAPLEESAGKDPIKPQALPGPKGGWNNDPYLYYDASKKLHVFFQYNPFASNWNHMHWGHLTLDKGQISNHVTALEPRPEQGYDHNFSGSILANKIPNPANPSQQVNASFFTAPGTGEKGFTTFFQAPPVVMAVTSDPTLDKWEATRYTVTDQNTYQNKKDTINGDQVTNRYDMRDPIVFQRDGKYFMIVAGTAVPGRVGQGVIALLKPSDPKDLSKPWTYVGDMFRHPQQSIDQGGPGILETPSLQRIGTKDVLVFGAQRGSTQGPLRGFNNYQGLQYFVGTFDSNTGKFTPDSTEPSYFEYGGKSVYAMNSVAKPGAPGKATLDAWIHGFDGLSGWKDTARGWNGRLTLPMTMSLVQGKPYVAPDEQLAAKRGKSWYAKESFNVSPNQPTRTSITERTLDIRTRVLLNSATSATLAVLAKADGTGGIPIVFDGLNVKVTDPETKDTETLPLFTSKAASVDLEVLVDRSVVAVFANGKMLHKVVNPPKGGSTSFADGVALSGAGGPVTFSQFDANSLK